VKGTGDRKRKGQEKGRGGEEKEGGKERGKEGRKWSPSSFRVWLHTCCHLSIIPTVFCPS